MQHFHSERMQRESVPKTHFEPDLEDTGLIKSGLKMEAECAVGCFYRKRRICGAVAAVGWRALSERFTLLPLCGWSPLRRACYIQRDGTRLLTSGKMTQ